MSKLEGLSTKCVVCGNNFNDGHDPSCPNSAESYYAYLIENYE